MSIIRAFNIPKNYVVCDTPLGYDDVPQIVILNRQVMIREEIHAKRF